MTRDQTRLFWRKTKIAYTELVKPVTGKLAGEEDNLIVGHLTMIDDGNA